MENVPPSAKTAVGGSKALGETLSDNKIAQQTENVNWEIEKRQPAGSTTGEKHPNTSSKLPFLIAV